MPLNKNPGPLLTSLYNGIVDLVPPRWRNKLGIKQTKQKVPLDVPPDTLTGKLVASQVTQDLTDERLKTNVEIGDPENKVMIEYIRTKDGQVATRTITYVPEGTPLPTFDALTVDASQEASGNGYSEQIVTTVPNVFGGKDYSIELRDIIPPEFVALLPTREFSETVAGIAAPPVLGTGELMRREVQETEQKKRVTVRYRDLATIPITITSYETNDKKQVVTVERTLELDSTAPLLPTALRDTKFDPLGNGLAVQTVSSISSLFVGAVYEKSILNLIPERFRGNVPTRRHSFFTTGAVDTDPPLGLGDLTRTETQTDEFNKRVEITSVDTLSIPITLVSYETNREKQIVTITDILELDTTPPLTPTAVRDTEFKPLGNGLAVQTIRQVPNVFVGAVYSKTIINLIPERFRGQIPTRRHDFTTTGAVSTDPPLGVGDLSRTETQTDEFNKRVETVYVDATTIPVTLVSFETNEKKQVVTVVDTLELDSVPPLLPTAIRDTEFKPLGNGLAVQTSRQIPGIFIGAVYAKSIINLIPERFRAGVPTRRHDFTETGAVNIDPPLGTGELSRTETQTDEFNKRVELVYIDATTLPVTFTSYETNDKKQVVTVTDTLELDSVTPLLPTAVRDTEFKPLGNGMAVQTSRTVPNVFVGAVYSKSIINLIPERFRAGVPTRRHDFTTTGSVNPDPPLSTGDLSRTETQVDEFNIRIELVYIDATTIPVTFVSYETNREKQVVTVTDTLEADSTTPLLPTALRDTEFKPLGNGLAVQTSRAVPNVFVGAVYAKSITNLIPERFRAGVPTRRHDFTTTGAVSVDPPLATGDLSRTETQTDEFNKRVELVYIDPTSVPVTFVSYETNEKKQVVTVTDTLELDSVTPLSPTAVSDTEFKPLGNGLAVQTSRTVPNVFVGAVYSKTIINLIPERFRGSVPTRRHEFTTTGAVDPDPTFLTGDLSRTETQVDEFNKRIEITYVDATAIPITFVSYETNREKQVVTVTDVLELDSITPLLPTSIRDTEFKPLGNGLAIQTSRTVPNVFVGAVYAKSIINLIPERFRAGVATRRHDFTTTGAVSTDPPLVTGDLSRTETQVDEFNKRVELTYIDPTTVPVTFVSYETNREKQVVTVTDTLELDSTTPLTPTAVRDTEFKPLGNGLAVQTSRTVPSVFVGAVYAKSIINLIPERFRGDVPTRKHDFTTTGAVNTDPPLATGDLSRTETQTDEFNKRVELVYIDPTVVPITLISYETNKEKQVVTVTDILQLDSVPPLDPTAVRDTSNSALGNGLAIQTIKEIDAIFIGAVYAKSITNLIPERFRAGVPTRRHDFTTTGAVAVDPPLATGDLSRTETQVDEFNKRVELVYIDPTTIPVTFVSYETSKEKQVVTVTDTLELDSTTPLLPTALRDVEFKPLGNGLAVQTSRAVPSVFVGAVYAKSIINLIPERFRAGVPTRKHDFTTTGAVSTDPPLATGDLSRSETQIDEFNKRVELVYIDATVVPVTFVSYETSKEKQVVTVTDILELDSVTPLLPTALRDTEFKPLGNGLAIQTKREVATLFIGAVYSKTIVNLIPERFRAFVPTRKHDYNETGAVSVDPVLATGDLSRTETQVDEFNKRIEIVHIDATTLPVSFTSETTNREKQVVTTTDTLDLDSVTPLDPTALRDVEFQPLGNGLAVQTKHEIATLFVGAVYAKSIINLIPERFRAQVPTRKHDFNVTGAVSTDPPLAVGDLSRTETQTDDFNKRVEIVYIDAVTLPVTFVSNNTTREKQLVTITDILQLDSVTLLNPTSVRDVEYLPLGNGLAVQTTKVVPSVFVGAMYAKSILNLIPERLRAAVPQRKHDFTTTGAVATDPPLAPGDLSRQETQIDEFNKRVETTSIDTIGIPVTVVDKGLTREFGGSTTTVTTTLAVVGSMTVDFGLLVLKSEITNLGNGYEIRATEAADAAWTQLSGQDYDERFDVIIPFTQQVLAAGVGLGTARTEIKPLDKWREESKTIDIVAIAAFLDTYLLSYPGRINVEMPDKLVSITSTIVTSSGEGTSSETGDFAATGSYSVSLGLKASAQSSVGMIPEVVPIIKQFWGNNIPCINYHFFLPSPVTPAQVLAKVNDIISGTVLAWPKFNPEMLTLTLKGGRVSVQATASSQGSTAVSTTGSSSTTGGGTGYSKEIGLSLKTKIIGPTIHPAITIGGTLTGSLPVSVHADSEAAGLGPAETMNQTATVTAEVLPTSFAATVGATNWPTTGLFLYRVDAQPYRFGYIQFHCIVVNAVDFPTN